MWPIIGHEQTVHLLERSISSGRVSHAYLFSGPPEIGKTTLARTFAQALNCDAPDAPCGHCRSCQAIGKETHPDFRLIQVGTIGPEDEPAGESEPSSSARGARRVIRISQIRALQHDASLLPYEGRWKVYIIRNAEDLNAEAANCLLKTLEEPPAAVVLILTTVDAKILTTTIVSRCQQFRLGLLPILQIQRELEARWGQDEDRAALLAHLSGGRIGWAINALADHETLEERLRDLTRIVDLSDAGKLERFKYVEEVAAAFARSPDTVFALLDLWQSWWRDLLMVASGCSELVTNVDFTARVAEQSGRYDVAQLYDFVSAIDVARTQLQQNVNARLALEAMVLKLPKPRR